MFSFVQTDSTVHPASFTMDTICYFLGEATDHPPTSANKECVDIYLHAPYISPLRCGYAEVILPLL